jgi:hypothetical protein
MTGGSALNVKINDAVVCADRSRSARARVATALVSVAVAATAIACAMGHVAKPEAGSPPRVFVGDVSGTDVRVAVVATPHRARIYFCGGTSSYATATKWLVADIDSAQHLTANARDNDAWRLDASIELGTIGGTVQLGDSTRRTFQATAVARGTIAGLYETSASCGGDVVGKVGLIVAQASTSSEPTGQGACIDEHSATVLQVNPIMPIAADDEGAIAVTTAGSQPALVRPATPPAE